MILNDIIELLSSNQGKLTDALLKTKVLLHQIGKKELVEWVNNELNGYPENAEVPPYRILSSRVLANIAHPRARYTAHPIPIGHLEQEQQDILQKAEMREPLAVLEEFVSSTQANLVRPLPMELNRQLGKQLGSYFSIESAWCDISPAHVAGILVHVRSSLLDFLLELQDIVRDTTTEVEFREKTKSIDTNSMFNNAVFGPNAMILVGHQSAITSTQSISDPELVEGVRKLVDELEKVLTASGLPASVQAGSETALTELRAASSAATPDVSRLRRGLQSLKHVMEEAAGHVVASGVLVAISQLLGRAAN